MEIGWISRRCELYIGQLLTFLEKEREVVRVKHYLQEQHRHLNDSAFFEWRSTSSPSGKSQKPSLT